jgi:hypothetical protein
MSCVHRIETNDFFFSLFDGGFQFFLRNSSCCSGSASAGDLCFGYKSETVSENHRHGRNQTPKKRYVIDEEKAVWVRQIFDWYVNENRSLQWIAKELTRLHVPKDHCATTLRWNHNIVHRIFLNKKYFGVWAWGQKRYERNPVTGKFRCFQCSQEEIVQYTRQFPELRLIDDYQFIKAQIC